MNVFFTLSAGFYLAYIASAYLRPGLFSAHPVWLLLISTAGFSVIYLAKYLLLRFSGWAFRVEGITEQYLYNVFLINKVMAIVLLPFSLILAFASPALAGPATIVSVLLVALLLANRYLRSWQVIGAFFEHSKFQFFAYLCASEILPLAVLIKLLARWLL
jgi:hypothetical protein